MAGAARPRVALRVAGLGDWRDVGGRQPSAVCGVAPSACNRPPANQMSAVLVADANQPAYLARVDASGGLQLAAAVSAGGVRPHAPAGRSLQLWGLPPGATTPRSLGVLPRDAGPFNVTAGALRAVPDMLILISQEPEGGSPTGLPTGPVVFYGRLVALGDLMRRPAMTWRGATVINMS